MKRGWEKSNAVFRYRVENYMEAWLREQPRVSQEGLVFDAVYTAKLNAVKLFTEWLKERLHDDDQG